jgi:hypothetical protein
MKLVYKFDVVCQQGVSSYFIGREVDGGIITKIEDHTWEHVDGEVSICLSCKDEHDNTLVSIYDVPVVIEYLKEKK